MKKSKPTLDIYYEICVRQIAYLYCLWPSLHITEDRLYDAQELVANFGHLIDGVDITENLVELGLQILMISKEENLASMHISLDTNRIRRQLKAFGSVNPKTTFATVSFNQHLETKKKHLQQVNLINVEKVYVDEDEVTSVTTQLCNLCLNIPENYVFRNTYDETLTVTLRSYKEFEFFTSLEGDDDNDDNDDNDAEDKSSVLGSKRKQPAERANIKQYDDLQARRKFDIINTFTDIVESIPKFARYSLKSFGALLRDTSDKFFKRYRREAKEQEQAVDSPVLGIELDDEIEADVEKVNIEAEEAKEPTNLMDEDNEEPPTIRISRIGILNSTINKSMEYLSKRRNIYDEKDKASMLEIFIAYRSYIRTENSSITIASVDRQARKKTLIHLKEAGYDKVNSKDIKRWYLQSKKDKKIRVRRGPKVNTTFEAMVWGELIIVIGDDAEKAKAGKAEAEKADAEKEDKKADSDADDDPLKPLFTGFKILVNTVYDYEIVKVAARKVQADEVWKDDSKVQALQFSNKWVQAFLKRNHFKRIKITAELKERPSEADIRLKMQVGQDFYIKNHLGPSCTWNMDETAFTYAIGPTHLFVPHNQRRGQQSANVKLRITAIITVNGNGFFAPTFIIIKHSKSSYEKPDQTTMTVLKALHKSVLTAAKGWELKIWTRTMAIKNKKTKKYNDIEQKCFYLQHKSGHIITSQCKAWNDQVRMAMYIDLIVMGFLKNMDPTFLLWMDNCGPHLTKAIEQLLVEHGITEMLAFFPKNCTDILQPLDLIVNKVLKSMIRRYNAERFVIDFNKFKAKYIEELKKALGERRKLKFIPSKPSYQDAIEKLIEMMDRFNDYQDTDSVKFASSIQKCFIDVGCVGNESNEFNKYDTSKMDTTGTSRILPIGEGSVIQKEVAVAVETLLEEDIDVFDEVSNLDPDEAMDDIVSIIDDDDYEDWNSNVAEDVIVSIDEHDIDVNDIDTDDDDDDENRSNLSFGSTGTNNSTNTIGTESSKGSKRSKH
jgi:hypothetical protein